MKIKWKPVTSERYCVDTGVPVTPTGARCRLHAEARDKCFTARRNPRCTHPKLSRSHPYPRCEECGVTGTLTRGSDVG